MTERRNTFNQDANLYELVRPGYPKEVFRDILMFSDIPNNGNMLEIGCGTGQATLPFAQRSYTIHCIELGENLATKARENLNQYPNVKVSVGDFEIFPLQESIYDLVISATAFHWIDPEIGYDKVAKILKPNGTIALFWNKPVQTEQGTGFFQTVQSIYRQVVPEMAKEYPGVPNLVSIQTPVKEEIERSEKFGEVTVKKYKWDQDYTSKAYIDLLWTYSDHISLDIETRERLLNGIRDHIDAQYGGQIVKEHLTILYLAKCKKSEQEKRSRAA